MCCQFLRRDGSDAAANTCKVLPGVTEPDPVHQAVAGLQRTFVTRVAWKDGEPLQSVKYKALDTQ